MKNIPHDKSFDATFAVADDGYIFVSKRCRFLKSDIFLSRIMLQKTICMQGREAAELFYNTKYFERKNIAPNFIKSFLSGHGGIQGLDNEAHRNRKELFMSLMDGNQIERLMRITANKWDKYADEWEDKDQIVLLDEAGKLLTEAVCEWTGVPLDIDEQDRRSADLGMLIEGSGTLSYPHWQGRLAHHRTEKWIEDLIKKTRSESSEGDTEAQNALQRISWHRDHEGKLLKSHIASTELINIIRPTVAVARYITFAALALHAYPETRKKILNDTDDEYLSSFADEVRRYYPFFPYVMARVKKEFDWKGYHFPRGILVLLDIYGTNHHPKYWDNPNKFNPDRFRTRIVKPFEFIPQGGGDFHTNHRCAGEWITNELLKGAVRFLTGSLRYEVPRQNLKIDLTKIPAIPKSHFVIVNLKKIEQKVISKKTHEILNQER